MEYFDSETRQRARAALVQYMKDHDIGVPALAKRITSADTKGIFIPVKTLQRFIAGTWRTNDLHVGLIARFVGSLNARDSIAGLGAGLAAAFESKPTDEYAGSYLQADSPKLKFEIMPDKGFWRVTAMRPKEEGFSRLEGVLIEARRRAFVVLKDVLTGLPASYIFFKSGNELVGMGYITPYTPDRHYPVTPDACAVTLSKVNADAV